MEVDLSKFADVLDKQGSGVDSMKVISGPRLGDQAAPIGDDATQDDAATTQDTTVTSDTDKDDVASDKEDRVPKSRFLKRDRELMEERHQRELLAKDFQRLEAELEAVRSARTSTANGDVPKWWVDRWGDSEESKATYETYRHTMQEELRDLRESIREEERSERQRAQEIEETVSQTFDDQLESLEDTLGKSLSDKQAADLLGIVEEYSPTDEDGNFESFISLDKAYEIYDMRQRTSRNSSKDHLAKVAGTTSQGDASPAPSNGPPQWGDWRRRVGG
jgi:hypothetical protein